MQSCDRVLVKVYGKQSLKVIYYLLGFLKIKEIVLVDFFVFIVMLSLLFVYFRIFDNEAVFMLRIMFLSYLNGLNFLLFNEIDIKLT